MTPWVRRLIIANVGVFVLQSLRPALTSTFAFIPALTFSRPWSVVTYMFLHGGVGHLFFNMLALFFFGPRLETEIGERRFLTLYMVSGVVGALLSLVTPFSAIVGASGAVFGVMVGFAHFWPREQIYIWGILGIEARWFVVIMTILSLLGGFGVGDGGIAHFAHLGGFAGGFLYIRWLERSRRHHMLGSEPQQPAVKAAELERWMTIPRHNLHEVNRDEFDRIMTKIKTTGVESLTAGERSFLDRFSGR